MKAPCVMIYIPPEIILGLEEIVDLMLDDFKSLRLVHPMLGELFAPRVLRNLAVPLSALINNTVEDDNEGSSTCEKIRAAQGKEKSKPTSSILYSILSSNFRQHIRSIRVQAFSNEQIPEFPLIIPFERKFQWEPSGGIVMEKFGNLLTALQNLKLIHLHVSIPVIGYALLPMVLRTLSSEIQTTNKELHFELTWSEMIQTNENLAIWESILGIHSLTIAGGRELDGFTMGPQLQMVINRNPQLTSLKFDIEMDYYSSGVPLLQIINTTIDSEGLYGPVTKYMNIEILHISGEMLYTIHETVMTKYGPIPSELIGRLKSLRELRISRTRPGTGAVKEFWEDLRKHQIWLEILSTRMMSLQLMNYLESPPLGRSLKVLHLDGFAWYYYKECDYFATELSTQDFLYRVVPNICNCLEELTISVYPRSSIYEELQESTKWTMRKMEPWSLSFWATGAFTFPKLRKLETVSIFPVSHLDGHTIEPEYITNRLCDFPNIQEISLTVVLTDTVTEHWIDNYVPKPGRMMFRQGAELYLEKLEVEKLEVCGAKSAELEYFYAGKEWNRRR